MKLYSIKNVSKSFEKFDIKKGLFKKVSTTALNNVSFDIKEGETIGLVGANGSGKTTLFNLMAGLYKPSNGSIFYKDVRIDGTIHLKDIAISLPNGVGLIPDMKVKQYLKYKSRVYGHEFNENHKYVDLMQTRELLNKKIAVCSAGEMQRVNILSTLLANTKVFMFDEPTNSLDIFTKYIFLDALEHLKNLGKTIILISHHTDEIIKMDRLLMLYRGEVYHDGPMPAREAVEEKLMELCKSHYNGGIDHDGWTAIS